MSLFFLILLLLNVSCSRSFESNESTEECSRSHILSAVNNSFHCQPMLKVIKLDIPGNGSFTQMTPRFISAMRCGGGCHSGFHSCTSQSTLARKVPVLLSSCGLDVGLCEKSCASLEVEEHTSCICGCPLEAQNERCGPRQQFSKKKCQCECKEEKEYSLCRDQGRIWDAEKCICRCPRQAVRPCSTGLTFDMATCSCISQEEAGLSNIIPDERFARSENVFNSNARTAEIVIISTLAGVATVFLLIILSLLQTIRNLRNSIKSIKRREKLNDSDFPSCEGSLLDTSLQQ